MDYFNRFTWKTQAVFLMLLFMPFVMLVYLAITFLFVDRDMAQGIITLVSIFLLLLLFRYLYTRIDTKKYAFTEEGIVGNWREDESLFKWKEITFIGLDRYLFITVIVISKYTDTKKIIGYKPTNQILRTTIYLEYRNEILNLVKKNWPGEIMYENRYVKKKKQD